MYSCDGMPAVGFSGFCTSPRRTNWFDFFCCARTYKPIISIYKPFSYSTGMTRIMWRIIRADTRHIYTSQRRLGRRRPSMLQCSFQPNSRLTLANILCSTLYPPFTKSCTKSVFFIAAFVVTCFFYTVCRRCGLYEPRTARYHAIFVI